MAYQDLFAKKISAEEQAARDAQKKANQLESDRKNPATGFGISVQEAATRLSIDAEKVQQMIAQGQFQTARLDVDRTGENNQYWVSGVEVFDMMGGKYHCSDADLH